MLHDLFVGGGTLLAAMNAPGQGPGILQEAKVNRSRPSQVTLKGIIPKTAHGIGQGRPFFPASCSVRWADSSKLAQLAPRLVLVVDH